MNIVLQTPTRGASSNNGNTLKENYPCRENPEDSLSIEDYTKHLNNNGRYAKLCNFTDYLESKKAKEFFKALSKDSSLQEAFNCVYRDKVVQSLFSKKNLGGKISETNICCFTEATYVVFDVIMSNPKYSFKNSRKSILCAVCVATQLLANLTREDLSKELRELTNIQTRSQTDQISCDDAMYLIKTKVTNPNNYQKTKKLLLDPEKSSATAYVICEVGAFGGDVTKTLTEEAKNILKEELNKYIQYKQGIPIDTTLARMNPKKRPVVLNVEHNEVRFIIHEAVNKHLIKDTPITLVNFDTHSDIYIDTHEHNSIADWINSTIYDFEDKKYFVKEVYWVIPDQILFNPEASEVYFKQYDLKGLQALLGQPSELVCKSRNNLGKIGCMTQRFLCDQHRRTLQKIDQSKRNSFPSYHYAGTREILVHYCSLEYLMNRGLARRENVIVSVDADYFCNAGFDTSYNIAFVPQSHKLYNNILETFTKIWSGLSPDLVTLTLSPEYLPKRFKAESFGLDYTPLELITNAFFTLANQHLTHNPYQAQNHIFPHEPKKFQPWWVSKK